MATHVLIKTKDFLSGVLNGDPNFHDKTPFSSPPNMTDGNWRSGGDTSGILIEKVDQGMKVTDTNIVATPVGTSMWTVGQVLEVAATGQPTKIFEVDYEIAEAHDSDNLAIMTTDGPTFTTIPSTVGKHKVRISFSGTAGTTVELKIRFMGSAQGGYVIFKSIAVREVKSVSTGDFVINIDSLSTSKFDSTLPSSQLTNKNYFSSTTVSVLDETPGTILFFRGPGDDQGQRYMTLFHDNPEGTNRNGAVIASNMLQEIALASKSKAKVVDITDKLPLIKHIEKDSY